MSPVSQNRLNAGIDSIITQLFSHLYGIGQLNIAKYSGDPLYHDLL